MSNSARYIIFFISVVAFVGGLFLINDFLETAQTNKISKSSNSNNSTENKILEVTSKTFEEEVLKSDKKILVDFYADWCGPCYMLHPTIEEIADENEDIKVVQIDIDLNQDLAIKYNVMSIPTLIVFENGDIKDKIVGVADKETILAIIKTK